MNKQQVAKICHEVNRLFCEAIGDNSQKCWELAEDWQRDSAVKGVEFALDNPNVLPSSQHDAWVSDKVSSGWIYGPVKDAAKKEHPCIVAYDELPAEQKAKDKLFTGIVKALIPLIKK